MIKEEIKWAVDTAFDQEKSSGNDYSLDLLKREVEKAYEDNVDIFNKTGFSKLEVDTVICGYRSKLINSFRDNFLEPMYVSISLEKEIKRVCIDFLVKNKSLIKTYPDNDRVSRTNRFRTIGVDLFMAQEKGMFQHRNVAWFNDNKDLLEKTLERPIKVLKTGTSLDFE